LTPRTFYCRAAVISLVSAFLGACSSTTGGLDVIATDLPVKESASTPSQTAAVTPGNKSAKARKPEAAKTEATKVAETDAAAPQANLVVAQADVAKSGEGNRAVAEAVAEAAANDRVAAAVDAAETSQQVAVASLDASVTSALPTPRPSLAVQASEVPVNAFAEQKNTAPLATVALEPAPSGKAVAANSPELHALISRYAAHYQVPESLVRRVVKRESNFDPTARNKIYWGLMQIRHDTARTMGYTGAPHGLLDAETNLKYAVKYLRGAYLTAGGNEDQAVRFYSRGYYYDAKRKGLLQVTGLRP